MYWIEGDKCYHKDTEALLRESENDSQRNDN